MKEETISQVLPAVTHDFLFHSTDPSFFHPLFVSKGLWNLPSTLVSRAREGEGEGEKRPVASFPAARMLVTNNSSPSRWKRKKESMHESQNQAWR